MTTTGIVKVSYQPMMSIRCVKCGDVLGMASLERIVRLGIAPSCMDCRDEVNDEVSTGSPVWPNGWHGKTFLGEDHHWWQYVEV
jgi:hypothetical protein